MSRKLVALLPFVAAVFGTTHASAIPLDTYGETKDTRDWRAPKVAPRTQCASLALYLADVPADEKAMRRYRFTGTCTFNTAPEGQMAKMKTVEVLVDAEYHPGMKRASERVVVQDPEFAVSFSTWATCTLDPFETFGAACGNKGMGANKFDKYISVEDVPYAANRVYPKTDTLARAGKNWNAAKQRGATAGSFFVNPSIWNVSPIDKTTAGSPATVILNVKGGAGLCPTELDFGDGKKQSVPVWTEVGVYQQHIPHVYAKPGFYKVTARSLPGCSGEGLAYALVK